MNTFAFYDYTSSRTGLPARLLVPAQRVARRVLRPMFHRLRDLLQYLGDRQQAQAQDITHVSERVDHSEHRIEYAMQWLVGDHEHIVAMMEQLAATREQLATVQDQLAALRRQVDDAIPAGNALRGLAQSHHALTLDHHATHRRIVMLEDLALRSAAAAAAVDDDTEHPRPKLSLVSGDDPAEPAARKVS